MMTALRGACAPIAFIEAPGELRPLGEFILERAAAIHDAVPLPAVVRSRSPRFGRLSPWLHAVYGSQGIIQSP